MEDPIDQFLRRYRKEYDFYDRAGRVAARSLEHRLRAAGIRAMVTSRPKAFEGLRVKVTARASTKHYVSADDVFNDIVDLAGVRIALYFPSDQGYVDSIIRSTFRIHGNPRTFPDASTAPAYEKRFSGYHATHYRVQLREDELTEEEKHCAYAGIELQVASVLMHAWAEVEHDLVYKPQQGKLSREEYVILDELNGMVLEGETDLMRLQKAAEARVGVSDRPFSNHYELATHLLSISGLVTQTALGETDLGSVDVLFEFLKSLNLNTPSHLRPHILSLQPDYDKHPFCDQIIDRLLSEDPSRYVIYERARALVRAEPNHGTYAQATEFLSLWVNFEKNLEVKAKNQGVQGIYASRALLNRLGITDDRVLESFERVKAVRSEVVHAFHLPSVERIIEAQNRMIELTEELHLS